MIFGNKIAVLQLKEQNDGNVLAGIVVDKPNDIYIASGINDGVGLNAEDRRKVLEKLEIGNKIKFLKGAILYDTLIDVPDGMGGVCSGNLLYVKICDLILEYDVPIRESDDSIQ